MLVLTLPKPQDHLRRGEGRPAKTGRAARGRAGSTMSVERRDAVLTAHAERVNQGTVTAGQYLAGVLKTDAEFAAAYDSPFGRAIKKAYIQLYGTKPPKIRLAAVRGRLHAKVGYRLGEPALALATRTYPRTAALNGADDDRRAI